MAAKEIPSFKLKLMRANEHRIALTEMLARSAYSDCELVPETDPQQNVGFLRVRLPKPSPWVGLLVGDFLFNVRACLDYLVWQLLEASPGRKHMARHAFPICSTPEAFAEQVRGRRLDGVPGTAMKIIEGLQPYPNRDNPLRRMADLHEIDKHRMLNLITAVAQDTNINWARGNDTLVSMLLAGEELRDGATFGDFRLRLDDPQIEARFKELKARGQAAVFVAFQDSTAEELESLRVDKVLQNISEFMWETVLPSFEQFFP